MLRRWAVARQKSVGLAQRATKQQGDKDGITITRSDFLEICCLCSETQWKKVLVPTNTCGVSDTASPTVLCVIPGGSASPLRCCDQCGAGVIPVSLHGPAGPSSGAPRSRDFAPPSSVTLGQSHLTRLLPIDYRRNMETVVEMESCRPLTGEAFHSSLLMSPCVG